MMADVFIEEAGLVEVMFGSEYHSDDDMWYPEQTPEVEADVQNAYILLHDILSRSTRFYRHNDVTNDSLYEDQKTGHVHILYGDDGEPHFHLWAFPSKTRALQVVNALSAVMDEYESPLQALCDEGDETPPRYGYCLRPYGVGDWAEFLDAAEATIGHRVRTQSASDRRRAVWDRLDRCPEWTGKGRGSQTLST